MRVKCSTCDYYVWKGYSDHRCWKFFWIGEAGTPDLCANHNANGDCEHWEAKQERQVESDPKATRITVKPEKKLSLWARIFKKKGDSSST